MFVPRDAFSLTWPILVEAWIWIGNQISNSFWVKHDNKVACTEKKLIR